MIRKLIKTVKVQPKKTAKQVMDDCDLSNLVSVHTTKCIIYENELKGCIVDKKRTFTKKHLKARLSWSKRYKLWDADAWNKILFCDETRTELHSNKQEFVRNLPGK